VGLKKLGWNLRLEEYVFWFKITMDQTRFFKHRQRVQQLCREHLHELCAQALKLILFDEFIKVGRKKLEDKAKMISVNERVK